MLKADPRKVRGALEKLCKWRTLFTGWQLGTRPKGDPESDAVRDHREVTILMRAELNAVTAALCDSIPGFWENFQAHLLVEAELLDGAYEEKFPGVRATPEGLVLDARAAETMKGWRP
jgi:hypothetical protein